MAEEHRLPQWLWLVCVSVTLLHCVLARKDDLIVRTSKGKVQGIRQYLPTLGKAVDAYLGIPYAKPPIDDLRFRHPQSIDRWTGIYNATKFPNSCYQTPDEFFGPTFSGSNMWNPTTDMSEDCLYLNVWVPKTYPRLRKAAVLVWIHGGGFFSGTSALDIYDGKVLASLNDIIVVSINYRVGVLGFLYLNHPTAPGNAGMFDQLMALEWVQQNIKLFGGDYNSVTIMGESAGAVSVSLHMLSYLSRHKFARAILLNGTPQMPWAMLNVEEAMRRGVEFAIDYMQCGENDEVQELAQCLRHVSPQDLVDNQWVTRGANQFPFLPIIDGLFLAESPSMSLRRKSFKKCPILMGSNLNVGSLILIYQMMEKLSLGSTSMSREDFLYSVEQMFLYYPQYPQMVSRIGIDAIAFQYTDWSDPEDKVKNIHQLEQAVGDSQFTCHVNTFANAYADAGQDVFQYLFTERYQANPWPEWMGVLQGDEIMFTFGEAFKPENNFTLEERELSKRMMTYWTNFAKTGNPNQVPGSIDLDAWPLHTSSGKEYLELNSKFNNESDVSQAVGRVSRDEECAFWREYLPELLLTSCQT